MDLSPPEQSPRTALAALLEAARGLGGDPPVIVAGAHAAALRAAAPSGIRVLENARWSEGRTGGVLLAHRSFPGRDLCLAPVDVPRVSAAVFEALGHAWREAGAPPEGWLAPYVEDPAAGGGPPARRHGHPVLVGRGLLARLGDADRALPLHRLRDRARPLLAVRVAEATILEDLDTPADLERLRRRSRGS